MKTFTDHAVEKMIDLYNNHSHEVGIQLKKSDPKTYKNYESTDCVTYVLNVLSYAFQQMGNPSAGKKAFNVGAKGTNLAKYLVNTHGWKGIYINPDVKHPFDASDEHTYSYHIVNKKCTYYGVPVNYKVVNYRPTSKTDHNFQVLNKTAPMTDLNPIDYFSLITVRLGVGISRGGSHTWLFSRGMVYEVHWDSIGAGLYEASPLLTYEWLSGAIFVPKEQAFSYFRGSSILKCN